MERVESKIMKLIGEKEDEDELFLAIERNQKINSNSRILKQLCNFLAVFGALFFIFGLFSILYRDKQHLFYFGLFCILHIVSGPLGAMAIKRKNRNLLLAFVFLNMLWLTVTLIFLFYYILKLDEKTSASKRQFKKEILLHVGLFFYIPMSVMAAFLSFRIMHTANEMKESSESSLETDAIAPKGTNNQRVARINSKSTSLKSKQKISPRKSNAQKTAKNKAYPKSKMKQPSKTK